MILFVAPNPNKVKLKEGYMHRVAAIDKLFSKEKRLYLEDLDTDDALATALSEADMVYVHSIYQAEKILTQLPEIGYKTVIDLHGVVPEEEKLANNTEMYKKMNIIEKSIFTHVDKFVAVSRAMVNHFKSKYPNSSSANWVVLPIFDEIKHNKNKSAIRKSVIYSGGAQPWQNIDKMISAINNTVNNNLEFVILTQNPDEFDEIHKDRIRSLIVKTVESREVFEHYLQASVGFVLRKDIIVNNVACPTKLIEYLECGVVPIVLSPSIGDFAELGYKYLVVNDFITKKLDEKKMEAFRQHNYNIMKMLRATGAKGKSELLDTYIRLIEHKTNSKKDTKNVILKNIIIHRLQVTIDEREKEIQILRNEVGNKDVLINSIINSRRWVISSKISQIIRLNR